MKVAKKKKKPVVAGGAYTGRLSPTENGETTLIMRDKLFESGAPYGSEQKKMFFQLNKAMGVEGYGSCKPAEQLRIFKKEVPRLLALYDNTVEALRAAAKNETRAYDAVTERDRKRWDPDEDDILVEMAASGNYSIMQMAVTMGRTPGAIQSRLTQLVGIGKVSQDIAGRFVGTINGEHVQGYIDGNISKE